jgi:hypothetical protein
VDLKWEPLEGGVGLNGMRTSRAPIEGGWLVRVTTDGNGIAMAFVPDEEHTWRLSEE